MYILRSSDIESFVSIQERRNRICEKCMDELYNIVHITKQDKPINKTTVEKSFKDLEKKFGRLRDDEKSNIENYKNLCLNFPKEYLDFIKYIDWQESLGHLKKEKPDPEKVPTQHLGDGYVYSMPNHSIKPHYGDWLYYINKKTGLAASTKEYRWFS